VILEEYRNHLYSDNPTTRWSPHPRIISGGSINDAADWNHLVETYGCTVCVNAESESSDAGKGIEHLLEVGAPNDGVAPPPEVFVKVLAFWMLHQDRTFYIHCRMGASRSATYIYFILQKVYGYSQGDALKAIHEGGRPTFGSKMSHHRYMVGANAAIEMIRTILS
jgi:hypothetical protein